MGREIEDGLSAQRALMVEHQLMTRGISDQRVLDAMRSVPRHLFVGEELRHKAYDDMALPIGQGQTISQPYMVAVMTELLEMKGGERVLELGTGSGYQTVVLAELSLEVFTVERVSELSTRAHGLLLSLGYENIRFLAADGTAGWPDEAPFDRILVTAGSPDVPGPLRDQLSDGGVMVIPVGSRFSQELIKVKKEGKGFFSESRHTPCVFVPLLGEHGWKDGTD